MFKMSCRVFSVGPFFRVVLFNPGNRTRALRAKTVC